MYCLANMCFLCLNNEVPIKFIILQQAENEIVQQVKFILPEIKILEPRLPLPICSTCREILSAFNNFKKICLDNNCRYNDYIHKLQGSNGCSKQKFGELEVTISEINLLPKIKEERNTHWYTQKLEAEENSLGVEIDNKELLDFTEEYSTHKLLSNLNKENSEEAEIDIKEEYSTPEDSIDPSYQEIVKKETGSNNVESCDGNINYVDQKLIQAEIQSSDQEVRIGKNNLLSNLNEEGNIVSIIEELEDNFDPLFSEHYRSSEQDITRETVQCQTNDFKCSACDEMFEQKIYLENHMPVHASENEKKCLICNKTFTSTLSLIWHMKAHAGMKDNKCSICNKMFRSPSQLKIHMTIHTGVKNYKCSVCNKPFGQKSHLKYHMTIHTRRKNDMSIHSDEKNYKCSICNKMLKYKSSLKLHMTIHTGEKKYKCRICNKMFIQSSHLKVHMTIHAEK